MSDQRPVITMVCTGNAARSVMAALLLRDRLGENGAVTVESAGTLVIPDQPMSIRTRSALERHGLRDPFHRSKQLDEALVDRSTLILTMEESHGQWMRRRLPAALKLSGSLKRVVAELPATASTSSDLAARVAELNLAEHTFEPWEEVIDPGSGTQDAFDSCIDELALLIDALVVELKR